MKRTANSVKAASQLSRGVIPLLLAGVVLPIVTLGGFGLYAIVDLGYLLPFLVVLTVSALLVTLPILWLKRQHGLSDDISLNSSDGDAQPTASVTEGLVEPEQDWGEKDHQVWLAMNNTIAEQLAIDNEWGSLREHALTLVTQTAFAYRGKDQKELAFSVPELLKMTEEVSRRYRVLLKKHVPYVENISVSLLKKGFDNKEKMQAGLESANWVWNAYRVARMANPYTALISEVRSKVLGEVFDRVSNELQFKLKQALLQEVVSVAINLYSGRFKVDDDELGQSHAHDADQQTMAAPLEPLRVCLVGQVSAGKSSLVNHLTGELVAEVNALPSTDKVTVHQCQIEGLDTLHLIDLPGLDGNPLTEQLLLEHVANADLVLWVLKANQSARELDTAFKAKLDAYYQQAEHQSRKRAPIIGVLNQVDKLSPVSEWAPPYDLEMPQSRKGKTIQAAMNFNQNLLGFDQVLPLSVSENKANFNVAALAQLLDLHFAQGAQAQLNRRRFEAGKDVALSEQFKRVYQSGKSLFKIITK
ncbi:GTPase family protein [Photobacterium jeanii]|uniref:GTPase family protein n=1 Tax=Photobacterium jeanii TaxID=858640 RepID=UPI00083354BF|nr:GTPase domain-containing protein [Photobacterium jeanii]